MLGVVGPGQYAGAPGTTAAEKLAALPANHSPRFAPDVRACLPTGVTAMTTAALTRLGSRPRRAVPEPALVRLPFGATASGSRARPSEFPRGTSRARPLRCRPA